MKLKLTLTIKVFGLKELRSNFKACAEQTGVDSGYNEADQLHIHTLIHGRGDSS
jgi:hypothetical protein